jgi:hypothetical protein
MADATVDDGADALKIRLEPPRPHVVGVAQNPAHDGSLAANVTLLRHDGCLSGGWAAQEHIRIAGP